MAKSCSRRWIIAMASILGAGSVLVAIPLFGYLALRLDLSLKSSSIGKPPLLDEPVAGQSIADLPAFSSLKQESQEEAKAAIDRFRNRYRELMVSPGGEESARGEWNGLGRWGQDWTPLEIPDSPQKFPPAIESEMRQIAAFVRNSDADFCFGKPSCSEDMGWYLGWPSALAVMPEVLAAHCFQGVLNLQAGESAKALEEVENLLAYGRFFLKRPCLLSLGLQRLAYEQAIRLVWEGLQRGAWTPAELGILRLRLGYLDYFKGANEALRGEVFYQRKVIDAQIAAEKKWVSHFAGHSRYRRHLKTYIEWIKPALTDSDEPNWVNRYFLESWQAEPEKLSHLGAVTGRAHPSGRNNPLQLVLKRQHLLAAADTACALELYRQRHGQFPETLEALKADQIVVELPRDPIDGKPLLYQRAPEGGYLLWSLGWNLTDDQGTVAFVADEAGKPTRRIDLAQGDWVWKMPAPK